MNSFLETSPEMVPIMSVANTRFPDIVALNPFGIETKAKRLIPWTYDVAATWADNALKGSAEITTAVAKKMKTYADLKVAELLDKALEEARATPKQGGGFFGLFKPKQTTNLVSYKPTLQLYKVNLQEAIVEIDDYLTRIKKENERLSVSFVAMACVIEVKGLPSDRTLEPVVSSRRVLLQQSVQQSNLLIMQLTELLKTISTQLATIDNLLYVTIPAFEIANTAQNT